MSEKFFKHIIHIDAENYERYIVAKKHGAHITRRIFIEISEDLCREVALLAFQFYAEFIGCYKSDLEPRKKSGSNECNYDNDGTIQRLFYYLKAFDTTSGIKGRHLKSKTFMFYSHSLF